MSLVLCQSECCWHFPNCPGPSPLRLDTEFDKWLEDPCTVYNLASVEKNARLSTIKKWSERGGVLLVSDQVFLRVGKDVSIQPHLIVLDEAHTMLKNTKTKIFQALSEIKTQRRIGELSEVLPRVGCYEIFSQICCSHASTALTGSPFQKCVERRFGK